MIEIYPTSMGVFGENRPERYQHTLAVAFDFIAGFQGFAQGQTWYDLFASSRTALRGRPTYISSRS